MKRQFADYGILYIDDEEKSLKYFAAIFDTVAPIYTASSPGEGYDLFVENHERIGLVLSDKKMPNESGIDLLRRIEAVDPRPFRFLVTAFTDLNLAVEALNDGLLYSYLSKPWDPAELEHRLVKAMKHFAVLREREKLIREKSDAFEKLAMADKAAGIGILSTGLNHHLRNSLTVLRTFYDMLPFQMQDELGHPPRDTAFWTDYYGEVGSQMERMTTMLSNLADGVRAGAVEQYETIELPDLISSSASFVFEEDGAISFDLRYPSDLPSISGDVGKIGQMMRLLFQESKNLLLPSGGEVSVEITPQGNCEGVAVTVLNDGDLIPESDLPHLFDPFFVRTDMPEELGTNMLACYLTTYHHGGQIRAFHSEDGRNGIEILLPKAPPVEAREEPCELFRNLSNPASEANRACETILPG